jgi:5-methylcytosine-specific restriction endonuclease McrA
MADLMAKQGGKCAHCAQAVQVTTQEVDHQGTVDHIVPISRGGINEPSNWQLLCRKCNQAKGNMLPEECQTEMGQKVGE